MQQIPFRINQAKLLQDVIKRQAGSLQKAVLEGVMNSIDAKATSCSVTVEKTKVTISDNGQGFRTKEEVDNWFASFGFAHNADEQKQYGAFRMGRGQLFAFGKNSWSTNNFRMTVDFDSNAEAFGFEYVDVPTDGCTVEIQLTTVLSDWDLTRIVGEIRKTTCWVDGVELLVNGVSVVESRPVVNWHIDKPDYRFGTVADETWYLKLFNQGVHIKDNSASEFGVAGVLQFKTSPKVNFARNDVMSDCPIWKAAQKDLHEFACADVLASKRISPGQRAGVLSKLASGLVSVKPYRRLPLISVGSGPRTSLESLMETRLPICVEDEGSVVGDGAHRSGKAFVVTKATMRELGFNKPCQLTEWLNTMAGESTRYKLGDASEIMLDSLTADILPAKSYTTAERKWLKLGNYGQEIFIKSASWYPPKREQFVGQSEAYDAWTDGNTYVAYNRLFLKQLKFTSSGRLRFGQALLHELCHYESSANAGLHGFSFYEEFHNRAQRYLPDFLDFAAKFQF